jgi:hypothetical protein
MEEESQKQQQYANRQNFADKKMTSSDTGQGDGVTCNNNTKPKGSVPQLRLLHELRAETYNGMVRMLKPGCRTIVVLVDAQSKNKLLPEFHRIVWPYRKYVSAVIIALYGIFPLWSSGQSSWLQIRRPGFDSRHYQKKNIVGLERGALSLVSTE